MICLVIKMMSDTPLLSPRHALATFAALAAVLVLTRTPGLWPAALPGASWAIFFLGGLYLARGDIGPLRPLSGLILLLGLAVLSDWLAIGALGANAACFTPGYVFLMPAYAALWAAGAWASRPGLQPQADTALRLLVAMAASSAAAFLIANLGFYWLGGNPAGLSAGQFAARVAGHYPGYLASTALWSIAALGLHAVLARWQRPAIAAS